MLHLTAAPGVSSFTQSKNNTFEAGAFENNNHLKMWNFFSIDRCYKTYRVVVLVNLDVKYQVFYNLFKRVIWDLLANN